MWFLAASKLTWQLNDVSSPANTVQLISDLMLQFGDFINIL